MTDRTLEPVHLVLSNSITNNPCAIKAHSDEPTFILLGRDAQAPSIIRLWASLRAQAEGPSEQTDEANRIADEMEKYRENLPRYSSPATAIAFGETDISINDDGTVK